MSSETKHYLIGNILRREEEFRNEDGDLTDPGVVGFKFADPDENVTTWIYGANDELVRDDTGQYHADISLTAAGTWWWKFYSTGQAMAADEGRFIVDASHFS